MDKQNAVRILARLVAMCDAAHASGAAYHKHSFSSEEMDLLILVADFGTLRIEASDEAPAIWISVQSGNGDWHPQKSDDPAIAAIAVSAFERLCTRGLMQHSQESVFVLNGKGFKHARELKNAQKQRDEYARAAAELRNRNEAAVALLGIILMFSLMAFFLYYRGH